MHVVTMRWDCASRTFENSNALASPSMVLYFGPNNVIASPEFQSALRGACPDADIMGCTTGTCIDQSSLRDDEAMAVALHFAHTKTRLRSTRVTVETSRSAGTELATALAGPDLAGVIVFCDSLNVEGEEFLDGMRAVLGDAVPISGGLASDGVAFERTLVGANCPPQERLVAAVGFYGNALRMTQGCAHGWDNFGPPRRVTKSSGSVLFELDGKPALDLYKHYLGDYAHELPSSALRFPLLVSDPADPTREVIRTVLDVDHEARSLTFAAGIKEGWSARLMRGAFENLSDGAGAAAREASHGANDGHTGLALLVSCVGRRVVLGEHTADEVEAVQKELSPTLRQVGFYSHGEISSRPGEPFCGLHNQTMTIVTLQEAA